MMRCGSVDCVDNEGREREEKVILETRLW